MIENNRAGAQFLCQRGSMAMSRALKQMNSFEMALAGEQLSGRMLVLYSRGASMRFLRHNLRSNLVKNGHQAKGTRPCLVRLPLSHSRRMW
jgi:hypothetical protein